MKALCWHSKCRVQAEEVPEPKVINPRDAIIKVSSTSICGSDLHVFNGVIPEMRTGDILGHEFMGEVVAVGAGVRNPREGDRVVATCQISCGNCFYCKNELWALCDNSNPNAGLAERTAGVSGAGIFGHSHLWGGYAGGQAEYVRVPFADVGLVKVPAGMGDEAVLFLSDIFPTGYQAAESCQIQSGDIVAVWGCGGVGQFAIQSAWLLGAHRVIAIDDEPVRLEMAKSQGAQTVETGLDVPEKLRELTGGRGPDACIDAVGLESHIARHITRHDQSKRAWDVSSKNPHVLRQAIQACRKGGIVSIAGNYAGDVDAFPLGTAFGKGLQIKMGETHVRKYTGLLMDWIEQGKVDPTFVITHRFSLEEGPEAYALFNEKENGCVKVVMKP
jgi:threonine dehydrogenase-like Zn-dependent dehydrogenase